MQVSLREEKGFVKRIWLFQSPDEVCYIVKSKLSEFFLLIIF